MTIYYGRSIVGAMAFVVLILWLIQGAVGVTLFVGWLRHARGRGAKLVVTHVAMMLAGLACWIWFIASGSLIAAWGAYAIITVFIGFGDAMLLARARRLAPEAATTLQAYGVAIIGTLRGRFPPNVAFHTWFSPVVWFTCLGVCIGATIAATAG
ncbi:hypothetical protein AB1K54_14150 [Microbacterium sp. BWT-B31]|uniref:hypothetical protein n=1 Tax=Microbacterium sp. BWT-B31 TaxID=3232072 RepID=UPI0035284236